MAPDDYDELDMDEEDFHEAPEASPLTKYEEIVFCPKCDEYMPYLVEGALVRRRCPTCGKLFEGGVEVDPGGTPTTQTPGRAPKKAAKKAPAPRKTPTNSAEEGETCAATTKAGTPCSNRPRKGSKYCSSHKGWRPPRNR
jgi:hypothetical protein